MFKLFTLLVKIFLLAILCAHIKTTNGHRKEKLDFISVFEDLHGKINHLQTFRLRDKRKCENQIKSLKANFLSQDTKIKNFEKVLSAQKQEIESLTAQVESYKEQMLAIDRKLNVTHNQLHKVHPEILGQDDSKEKMCKMTKSYSKSCGQLTHTIYPTGLRNDSGVEVLCDFTTDGGGWTTIQKRSSGPKEEFCRSWEEYEKGFGSPDKNFWIGLKNIHALTKDQDQELRIDLQDFQGRRAYAKYYQFFISDSSDLYRLWITGYSGNVGDALGNANGSRFTTEDRKNHPWPGVNCAEHLGGAWWFVDGCGSSNLNGLYYEKGEISVPDKSGVLWADWRYSKDTPYSLQFAEMKIRKRR